MNNEIETKGTTITKYTCLTKVVIPDGATTIGDYAFHGCPCWMDLRDRVAEIQNDKVTGEKGNHDET